MSFIFRLLTVVARLNEKLFMEICINEEIRMFTDAVPSILLLLILGVIPG